MDASIRIRYAPRNNPYLLLRQYYNYGYGRALSTGRDLRSFGRRQFLISLHFIFLTSSLLLAPIWFPALAYWAAYLGLLASTSILIAVKKHSGCGLLAGFAALLMHIGWGCGFLTGIIKQLLQITPDKYDFPPLYDKYTIDN